MRNILLFMGIVFCGITLQAQIVVGPPNPLMACDDDNDGFAAFDLHQADADITLGDPSLTVSYYDNLWNAMNNLFPLISVYYNVVPYIQTLYARAENGQGDFAIVDLELIT